MAMRADDLIDRRRLRRKLTFWRVATFVVLAAALIAFSAWIYSDDFTGQAVD
ncbi:signal peptide peptidase SppA, partial [Mesorhizobium sp. M1E.F.Ca.ET.063.01.1.1]